MILIEVEVVVYFCVKMEIKKYILFEIRFEMQDIVSMLFLFVDIGGSYFKLINNVIEVFIKILFFKNFI